MNNKMTLTEIYYHDWIIQLLISGLISLDTAIQLLIEIKKNLIINLEN